MEVFLTRFVIYKILSCSLVCPFIAKKITYKYFLNKYFVLLNCRHMETGGGWNQVIRNLKKLNPLLNKLRRSLCLIGWLIWLGEYLQQQLACACPAMKRKTRTCLPDIIHCSQKTSSSLLVRLGNKFFLNFSNLFTQNLDHFQTPNCWNYFFSLFLKRFFIISYIFYLIMKIFFGN